MRLSRNGEQRWLVLLSVTALAGARLVMQFTSQPTPRIVLGTIGIIAWGWCLIALLSAPVWRDAVAAGCVLGLAADTLVRSIAQTIDLPWAQTSSRAILTGIFV